MCTAIQYSGITRSRFNCLQQAANQQLGMNLTGDTGTATDPAGSNTVSWAFDETSGVLTLQATQTPYPCFLVKSKLNSFVGSCP